MKRKCICREGDRKIENKIRMSNRLNVVLVLFPILQLLY